MTGLAPTGTQPGRAYAAERLGVALSEDYWRDLARLGDQGRTASPPVQEDVPQPIPAQWYVDPNDASQWRFWDGHQWTENVSPAPKVAHLPLRSNRQTNALNCRDDARRVLSLRRGTLG
jgi:hypothetical protein